MSIISPLPYFSFLPLVFLLLSACSAKIHRIRLLSDHSALAQAAEMYNSINENVIITFREVISVDTEILNREESDLIIGRNLETPELLERLDPLRFDIPGYKKLQAFSSAKGKTLLLPLAFEMPLIMTKKETLGNFTHPSVLSPELLRSMADTYRNKNSKGRLTRVGFSPSWNPYSLTDLLDIRRPQAFINGLDETAASLINPVIEEMRSWIEGAAGDVLADKDFIERYRYLPDEKLIQEGYILFARTDFNSWNQVPNASTKNFALRYLGGPKTIPIISLTSGAIPRYSKARKQSERFLLWLTQEETQKKLITLWEANGLPVFGFLGGLSSLPAVNEKFLVKRYPYIARMLPEERYLARPVLRPNRWARVRNEVLLPWLNTMIEDPQKASSLSEYYHTWDLSSLVHTNKNP